MVETETELANLALSRLGARRIADLDNDTTPEANSCRLHYSEVRDDLLRRHQWNFAIARKTLLARWTPWITGTNYVIGDQVFYAGTTPANYVCIQDHTAGPGTLPDAESSAYWGPSSQVDQMEDPTAEWATRWQLPSDMVRFIRIAGCSPNNPVNDFALEMAPFGLSLFLQDKGPPTIVYVTNQIQLESFDSLFIQAFTLSLAAKVANDITQNAALAANLVSELEKLALPEAKNADAREVMSGENFGVRHMIGKSGLVGARFRQDGRPPVIR